MTYVEARFAAGAAADMCERKLSALRAHDIRVTQADEGYIVSADVTDSTLDQVYAVLREHDGTPLNE
ncbi:hypothetical protein [Paenibacillus apiarius]|uniref:hypothetical protein n=1 Tax=Paenibacillus apiarius TaxID=46240 RepID=UPI00197D7944|nr:hypothetical protein [Paenibacillus apiarius]MBN3525888.1 hypothetical protein [Paenibacillus apiarius]